MDLSAIVTASVASQIPTVPPEIKDSVKQETLIFPEFSAASSGGSVSGDEDILAMIEQEKTVRTLYATEADDDATVSKASCVKREDDKGGANSADLTKVETNDPRVENLAKNYLGKNANECSHDELNKAYAVYMIENMLNSTIEGLEIQDASDGIISEWFDAFKEANGIDLTQSTVEEAIRKQTEIVNILKQTLINAGDFEATWAELTGVEYNEEKIAQYQQKMTELQFVQMGIGKINNFHSLLQSSEVKNNPTKMLDAFVKFYGEEKGKQEFCTMVQSSYNRNPKSFYFSSTNQIKDMTINENSEYVATYEDGTTANLGSINYTELDALQSFYTDGYKELKVNKYLENIKTTMGLDYEQIIQDCNKMSEEAFGDANAASNTLNEYIASQNGFIDTTASASQIGGMFMMVAGGFACLIPGTQTVGGLLLSAGRTMALVGTFGDEALEFVDTFTNNNDYSQDKPHYQGIMKETLTDIALFTAGYAIGGAAGEVGEWAAKGASKWIASEAGQKFVSAVAELGVDGTLSLLTDMIITGEALTLENVTMETMSQLLGVLTGAAVARLNKSDAGNPSKPNMDDSGNNKLPDDYDDTQRGADGWEDVPDDYDDTQRGADGWEDVPDDYDDTQRGADGWEDVPDDYDGTQRGADGWEDVPDSSSNVMNADDFNNLDLNDKIEYLESLGLGNEASTRLSEMTKGESESFLQIIDSITKNNPEKIELFDELLNIGIEYSLIDKLCTAQYFGRGLKTFSTQQLDALKSLDVETLKALEITITDEFGLTSGNNSIDISKNFDKFNFILYGPPLDPKMKNDLISLGQEYGVSIKSYNNLQFGKPPSLTAEEYLASVKNALETMRNNNIQIPKEVYIVDMPGIEGMYSGKCNGDAITIAYDTKHPENTIYHETNHMLDWNPEIQNYNSRTKKVKVEYGEDAAGNPCETIYFNDMSVSSNEIVGLVSFNARFGPEEFVADIGVLLANGAITLKPDGSYSFDASKIPAGYCSEWNGTKEDCEKLDRIIEYYKYLTS